MRETSGVSQEAFRLCATVAAVLAAAALAVIAITLDGPARIAASTCVIVVLVAVITASAGVMRRGGLRHADPGSRLVRFEHFIDQPVLDPEDRFCPHCGRKRFHLTPLNYLPATAEENGCFCTPWSCESYSSPSCPRLLNERRATRDLTCRECPTTRLRRPSSNRRIPTGPRTARRRASAGVPWEFTVLALFVRADLHCDHPRLDARRVALPRAAR